jgi:hypothetical protein
MMQNFGKQYGCFLPSPRLFLTFGGLEPLTSLSSIMTLAIAGLLLLVLIRVHRVVVGAIVAVTIFAPGRRRVAIAGLGRN